jgi:hypothetical protein
MVDQLIALFRSGWALTQYIAQSIWDSLGFVGQYMLVVSVGILLVVCARGLVLGKEQRKGNELAPAPNMTTGPTGFAKFYNDLNASSKENYTYDEAYALFGWLVGNPELSEPRSLSEEEASRILKQQSQKEDEKA